MPKTHRSRPAKLIFIACVLLIAFVTFVFWPRPTKDQFATGLNGQVTARLDSQSTVSENNGLLTLTFPGNKRIEISQLDNKFPQAKSAKEYNQLDRLAYEKEAATGSLPPIPGFTDNFLQEVEPKNSNWDSAIEVNAFHLASSQGLQVKKFLVLKNSHVYEVYFIFPPDFDYSKWVVPTLQYVLIFK